MSQNVESLKPPIAVAITGLALLLTSCGGSDAEAVPKSTVTSVKSTVAAVVVTIPASTTVPGPQTYVIQSGDTLGVVAQRFGVALTDLIALNGIDDPDRISVGLEIVIPDGTTPIATTTTAADTTTTTAG
ncbi:MAG: LysM peptidoglycan-binding domain-containing protein [Actinomycetia bacterium]|nr:LysM peptidoglycan-binding domain-containing protein [Actinomycetes bacterium]